MVITPESSNEFPWIPVWRFSSRMPAIVSIHSKHAGCVCWIVPIVTFDSIKRTCGCLFEMHLISGITDGCEPHRPPAKRNVKTRPLPSCILVFAILLISVDCCFFAFFGVFSSDFGFLYSRSIPNLLFFLHYFLSVGQWVPFSQVSPWLKPYCVWSKLKVVLQMKAMCRATSIILQ